MFEGGKRPPFLPREPYDSVVYSSCANALIILRERGFIQKYLRDYERLYDVDVVEVRDDPSSSHILKCVNCARCPMPSQLMVPLDMLQKLNTYFKSNQRFKKDKLRRAIKVDILPQLNEDEAWERGWHVRVNAREFCQQLLSIQYRVRSGDRFDQRQRNELCLTNLYRLFDWDTYKEDIANVIKISVHERKLRNTSTTRYPLESTFRLDQFFDRDEMTCIALLNLAVFNHVCKTEEEYCFVCITPISLRYPSQQRDDGEDGGKKKDPPKPSAQEINKLEDIVYRYGGESMILRTKEGTPIEVLQAYKMLNKIHGASKQCLRAIFIREKQKTIGQIKSIVFNSCKTYLPMIPHGFPRLDSALVVGSFDAMEVMLRPALHPRAWGPPWDTMLNGDP